MVKRADSLRDFAEHVLLSMRSNDVMCRSRTLSSMVTKLTAEFLQEQSGIDGKRTRLTAVVLGN